MSMMAPSLLNIGTERSTRVLKKLLYEQGNKAHKDLKCQCHRQWIDKLIGSQKHRQSLIAL